MGNHVSMRAMEFLCSTSFERRTVASSEMYWLGRILCLVLLNDYFLKCPKNVELDLEQYLSVTEIFFFLKRQKTSMVVRKPKRKTV